MNSPYFFQVDLWKKYIAFEKSNPLRSEDTALVTRRVMFATEQCLLVLTHHPAVWHQAAQYLDQSSKLLTEKGVRNFDISCWSFCIYCQLFRHKATAYFHSAFLLINHILLILSDNKSDFILLSN